MRNWINIIESAASVVGPYRVNSFDPETREMDIEGAGKVKLAPEVKDLPRAGFNYAFVISNGVASRILSLTVDNVITTGTEVLMIKRKGDPYAGHWALPGGFIEPGEKPEIAAKRELAEETGLVLNANMKFVGKFDTPGRDPRMHDVWSYAYAVKIPKEQVRAGDDASAAKWIPINQLANMQLAFDHAEILRKAGIL